MQNEIKPMSAEETIESSKDFLSAIIEGYILGRLGIAEKVHPEIKDEIATELRHALAAYTKFLLEKMSCVYTDPDDGVLGEINETVDDCRSVLQDQIDQLTK